MAADVHDLIMQDLSFALANARTLVDDPAQAPQATTVVTVGERALAGARDVVSALAERNPQPIVQTIEASVRAAARHVPLTFDAAGVPAAAPLDRQTRDALQHIAREAVTNAVKYARANAIEVVLARDDEWRLTIHDDGPGFDPDCIGEGFGSPACTGTHTRSRLLRRSAGHRHDAGSSPPMSDRAPTVVIADDHPVIRVGVRMALMRGGFEVRAEAADRDGAVEAVLRERPDVCLLDICMPGGGIEAAAILARSAPGTALSMMTVSESASDLLSCLRSGAKGYLPKDTSPEPPPGGPLRVLKGEAALPGHPVGRVLNEPASLTPATPGGYRRVGLTAGESEIMRLLNSARPHRPASASRSPRSPSAATSPPGSPSWAPRIATRPSGPLLRARP
jgi:two-component system NarL family response regulator